MKKGVPSVYLVWRVSLDLGLPGDGVSALSITLQSGRQLSSAASCCDWRPVPQPSSAGRSRGWGPHKVPGEVAHHRTFYLFQLPRHHFSPAKRSFDYFCTSILQPAASQHLITALASPGRDKPSPSLLGRMNLGLGT